MLSKDQVEALRAGVRRREDDEVIGERVGLRGAGLGVFVAELAAERAKSRTDALIALAGLWASLVARSHQAMLVAARALLHMAMFRPARLPEEQGQSIEVGDGEACPPLDALLPLRNSPARDVWDAAVRDAMHQLPVREQVFFVNGGGVLFTRGKLIDVPEDEGEREQGVSLWWATGGEANLPHRWALAVAMQGLFEALTRAGVDVPTYQPLIATEGTLEAWNDLVNAIAQALAEELAAKRAPTTEVPSGEAGAAVSQDTEPPSSGPGAVEASGGRWVELEPPRSESRGPTVVIVVNGSNVAVPFAKTTGRTIKAYAERHTGVPRSWALFPVGKDGLITDNQELVVAPGDMFKMVSIECLEAAS